MLFYSAFYEIVLKSLINDLTPHIGVSNEAIFFMQ